MYFGLVSIFFDLFNPNNRHRTEELRRLENTREEEAQGEPGRGPIDLKSGMVVIRPPATNPQQESESESEAGPDGEQADEGAATPAEGDDGA
jgi:hypothetical protein